MNKVDYKEVQSAVRASKPLLIFVNQSWPIFFIQTLRPAIMIHDRCPTIK